MRSKHRLQWRMRLVCSHQGAVSKNTCFIQLASAPALSEQGDHHELENQPHTPGGSGRGGGNPDRAFGLRRLVKSVWRVADRAWSSPALLTKLSIGVFSFDEAMRKPSRP